MREHGPVENDGGMPLRLQLGCLLAIRSNHAHSGNNSNRRDLPDRIEIWFSSGS